MDGLNFGGRNSVPVRKPRLKSGANIGAWCPSFVKGNATEQAKLTPEGNSSSDNTEEQTECNHSVKIQAPVPRVNLENAREGVSLVGERDLRCETV